MAHEAVASQNTTLLSKRTMDGTAVAVIKNDSKLVQMKTLTVPLTAGCDPRLAAWDCKKQHDVDELGSLACRYYAL